MRRLLNGVVRFTFRVFDGLLIVGWPIALFTLAAYALALLLRTAEYLHRINPGLFMRRFAFLALILGLPLGASAGPMARLSVSRPPIVMPPVVRPPVVRPPSVRPPVLAPTASRPRAAKAPSTPVIPPAPFLSQSFLSSMEPDPSPDHRGEVTVEEPTYRGTRASAPIPKVLHVRNEGGSDGAGLCVISSVLANGMYQGVPGLAEKTKGDGRPYSAGKGSRLWQLAKSRPGGYSPDKLKSLVRETLPNEPYASLVGSGTDADFEMIEALSKAGIPIGMTMNTAALYRYQPIHHMVSWPHFRRTGYSCFVDNNNPGFFSWVPSAEAMRRAVDQGVVWAWAWTRRRAQSVADNWTGWLFVIIVGLIAYLLLFGEAPEEEEEACSP